MAFSSQVFPLLFKEIMLSSLCGAGVGHPDLERNHFYSYQQGLCLGHKDLLLISSSSLEEKKLSPSHGRGGKAVQQAVLKQMVFFLCVHISKHPELALILSSVCIITWVKLEGGSGNSGNVFGTGQ